jgi:uncharacterized membrane protein
MSKKQIIILAIIVSSFAVALAVYPYLPERVASHWDAAGQVNGYASRFWGAFLAPIILAASYLLFLFIPKIDPKKENIQKFRPYFENFILAFVLFLYYIYLLTLFWNLGWRFELVRFLSPAFAALFYVTGSMVGHAEPNWFIGIRTPWTLSSPEVWKKTHELGGKLFKITAAFSLLGVIFPGLAIWLVLVPVLAAAVYLVVYSYVEYRKLAPRN